MTPIAWFWTVVIVLLLLLFRVGRRYLGRVILILLFLFVLFFIFKRINPSGAEIISHWVLDVPSRITSFFGEKVSDELVISSGENLDEEKPDLNPVDWTGEFFWVTESSLKTPKRLQLLDSKNASTLHTGTLILGTGLIVETGDQIKDQKAEPESLAQENAQEDEENEIIYVKSNPKLFGNKHWTLQKEPSWEKVKSRGLSEKDLKEAQEIFGN